MSNKILSKVITNSLTVIVIIGIVLFILKLLNLIQWSWTLVTLPFWGGFILSLIFLGVPFVIMSVVTNAERKNKI